MSLFSAVLTDLRARIEATIPAMMHSRRYEVFYSPSHSGTNREYMLIDQGSVGHGPSEGEASQRDETRRLELTIKYVTKFDIATVQADMVTDEETLTLALIQYSGWTTEIFSVTKESSKSDKSNKSAWYNTIVFDVLYRYP